MTNDTKTTVRVHRVYINAPAQKVWDAITDPQWNGRYAFKAPSEYDLRPGGAYRVVSTPEMVNFGAPEVLIDGEVLECDAPLRLVQTWRAHFTPETVAEGFTRLTWELEEDPPGMTRLTVTHDVENAPAVAARHGRRRPDRPGRWWLGLDPQRPQDIPGDGLAGAVLRSAASAGDAGCCSRSARVIRGPRRARTRPVTSPAWAATHPIPSRWRG